MARGGHNWKGHGTVDGTRSLDVMNTPEFGRHVHHIRALFNVKGGVDA